MHGPTAMVPAFECSGLHVSYVGPDTYRLTRPLGLFVRGTTHKRLREGGAQDSAARPAR